MGLKATFQADAARWELEAARTPLRRPWRRQPGARCDCSQDGHSSTDNSSDGSSLLTRRQAAAAAAVAATVLLAQQPPRSARASALGPAVDGVWQALGGGPPDLHFPPSFLGVWEVTSTLVRLELPLGPEAVPDMSVVQRARAQDLGRPLRYRAAFVLNARGQPVADRAFNTAALLEAYTGTPAAQLLPRVRWSADDPNLLTLEMPGGLQASTRVVRRSQESPAPDRLTTSELVQEVLQSPARPQPKVKASRCLTKYHWRTAEQAAGAGAGADTATAAESEAAEAAPEIVASQVVSDFLVPGFGLDAPAAVLQAGGQPHSVYTYRMAFRRCSLEATPGPAAAAAAEAAAAAAEPLGGSLAL